MEQEVKQVLRKFSRKSEECCGDYHIACIANVKGLTIPRSNYSDFPVESEYFSQEQLTEIENSLTRSGHLFSIYTDESDFIKDVELTKRPFGTQRPLVLNFAQQGTGSARKSLIPAFCDMHGIPYAGSNAFASSLCRHKTTWHGVLRNLGCSISDFWTIDPYAGWIGDRPPLDTKLIVKLDGETSSIGLSKDTGIIKYSPSIDKSLIDLARHHDTRLLLEKFVSGKEVEIPLINHRGKSYCLGVAGISYQGSHALQDTILDYDIRGNHKFGFYDFAEDDFTLAKILADEAKRIAITCNLDGYCRVDFRIDDKGDYCATDISSTPHLTKSMTFAFLFAQENIPYEHIYSIMIGQALSSARYGGCDE